MKQILLKATILTAAIFCLATVTADAQPTDYVHGKVKDVTITVAPNGPWSVSAIEFEQSQFGQPSGQYEYQTTLYAQRRSFDPVSGWQTWWQPLNPKTAWENVGGPYVAVTTTGPNLHKGPYKFVTHRRPIAGGTPARHHTTGVFLIKYDPATGTWWLDWP